VTRLPLRASKVAVLSLMGLMALAPAFAQSGGILRATIPFAFQVHGTTFPPGSYKFKLFTSAHYLIVSGGANDVRLPIITQLGGSPVFRDAGLVFDTLEGQHLLSEIWIPGQEGVLVGETSKQHGHERVIAMIAGGGPNLSGKEVFERTCARCHGDKGTGNPSADKFFKTPVPKLASDYVQTKSDAELREIISSGKGAMDPVRVGQASVQHLLASENVDAVIAYVRTLKQ